MKEIKFLDTVHFDSIPLGLQGKEGNPYLRAIAPLVHFPFIPTFGVSMNESDALNVLADAQYVYVRHFNSGSRNYGSADLFQYELATISGYLIYAFAKKALGLVKLFDKHNRALAKSLAMANMIDLDDIRANTKDFTAWLNLLRDKLATFVIPSDIAILPRWFSLVEGVIADDYTDGQTKQLYDFSPAFLYYYDWENSAIKPLNFEDYEGSNGLNFKSFRDMASEILSHLQNSDDVGTISGDLLKAYGDKVYTLSTVEENYVTPIIRATNELLAYIRNADLIVNPTDTSSPVSEGTSWEYTQVDALLRFNPIVAIGSVSYTAYKQTTNTTSYNVLTNIEEANQRSVVIDCFNNHFTGKRVVDFLSDQPTETEQAAALVAKFVLQLDSQGRLVESFNDNISVNTNSVRNGVSDRFYALERCGSEVLCMPYVYYVDSDNSISLINCKDFMNRIILLMMDNHEATVADVTKVTQTEYGFASKTMDAMSQLSYLNQFDCIPHYFVAWSYATKSESSSLKIHNSYPGTPNTLAERNGYLHNETHNLKYLPTAAIEYALEAYCWDNLVNDLWLNRSR